MRPSDGQAFRGPSASRTPTSKSSRLHALALRGRRWSAGVPGRNGDSLDTTTRVASWAALPEALPCLAMFDLFFAVMK